MGMARICQGQGRSSAVHLDRRLQQWPRAGRGLSHLWSSHGHTKCRGSWSHAGAWIPCTTPLGCSDVGAWHPTAALIPAATPCCCATRPCVRAPPPAETQHSTHTRELPARPPAHGFPQHPSYCPPPALPSLPCWPRSSPRLTPLLPLRTRCPPPCPRLAACWCGAWPPCSCWRSWSRSSTGWGASARRVACQVSRMGRAEVGGIGGYGAAARNAAWVGQLQQCGKNTHIGVRGCDGLTK